MSLRCGTSVTGDGNKKQLANVTRGKRYSSLSAKTNVDAVDSGQRFARYLKGAEERGDDGG